MPKIKLKEWADKHNLSYLTANRHFHAGMIPGAIQLDSGTILVEDESMEQNMAGNTSNEAMSLFLKKTVEYSKNNSTVEDFAAFVISNFQLKLNGVSDNPRYSKNKPKAEEVQKHFQKFIPDPKDIEHLKAVKTLLKEGKTAGDVVPAESSIHDSSGVEMMENLLNSFEAAPDSLSEDVDVHMYGNTAEGLITRSVDLNTTPQQINYTGSNNQTFSGSLSPTILSANSVAGGSVSGDVSGSFATPSAAAYAGMGSLDNPAAVYFSNSLQSPFQPTQKELLSAVKVIETAETEDAPRKRGRKPSKKR